MISYTRGKDLLVLKASAGSGKTYNLVLFYLKYAFEQKNPEYFKRILAVTFTNKAANEMKKRILESLHALQLDTDDRNFNKGYAESLQRDLGKSLNEIQEQAKNVLHHILHNYSDFAVMTIDKFVHRLIRSFSKELDINMDFEVEMDQDGVLKSVADELISNVGTGDPQLSAFIENMVQDSLADGGQWKHNEKLSQIAHLLVDDEYIEEVKEVTGYSLESYSQLLQILNDDIKRFEGKLVEYAKAMRNELAECNTEVLEMAHKKGGFGGRLYKYLNGDFLDVSLPKRFFEAMDKENWFSKTHELHQNDELNQSLTQIGEKILQLNEELATKYQVSKKIRSNLYWVALLSEMKVIFNQMKEEQNFLLISEFNQKATALILEESVPFIYEKLGEKYDHFLIDEFQDTSVLQFRNFLPLIDNALSKGHHNLIVGDGKQSIYRFRGGKVEQFNHLPNVWNTDQNEKIEHFDQIFGGRGEAIPIQENWRSSQAVVSFNNMLYTSIASQLHNKKKGEFESIIPSVFEDVTQHAQQKEEGFVQLKHERFEDKHEAEEWHLDEVEEVVRELTQDSDRPFNYADIAILVSTRVQGGKIASALSEKGVPVISEDSLVVLSDYQVQLLWTLNQFWVYPKNINLKKEILIRYARIKEVSAHELLQKYIFTIDEESKKKDVAIHDFFEAIGFDFEASQWAKSSVYLRNLFWMNQLDIDFTNNAYVERFVEEIFQFEQYNGPSTTGFVKHFQDRKNKVSISTPDGENAVQIMTIHKSKGLEFKVVLLPFLNWPLLKSWDGIMQFIDIKPFGYNTPIEKAYVSMSKDFAQINDSWKDARDSEEDHRKLDLLNQLYVATTRAEKELYVFTNQLKRENVGKNGAVKNTSERISDWILEAIDVSPEEESFEKTWGEKYRGAREELKHSIAMSFTLFSGSIPQDISYVSTFYNDTDEEFDLARRKGKLMHKVLEHITTKENWEREFETLQSKDWMDEEIDIRVEVQSFVENPKLESFFKEKNVIPEQAVINERGESYRVDRLWMNEDEVHIVDFKLGKKDKKHAKYERQVARYMDLLHSITGKKVLGLIAYTDGSVLEVNQTTLF